MIRLFKVNYEWNYSDKIVYVISQSLDRVESIVKKKCRPDKITSINFICEDGRDEFLIDDEEK